MQHPPCESMIWHGLPAIRKELARCLISNHGLTQRAAAQKLGITPAAISQYLSKKRGCDPLFDKRMDGEIALSAARIVANKSVAEETCRLCQLIQKTSALSTVCAYPLQKRAP